MVSFDEVAHWWTNNENSYYTFQFVLYPSGRIDLNYQTITGTNSATIGIQDESGSVGLQVSYNNNYIHENLSVQFIKSDSADWLEISCGFHQVAEKFGFF